MSDSSSPPPPSGTPPPSTTAQDAKERIHKKDKELGVYRRRVEVLESTMVNKTRNTGETLILDKDLKNIPLPLKLIYEGHSTTYLQRMRIALRFGRTTGQIPSSAFTDDVDYCRTLLAKVEVRDKKPKMRGNRAVPYTPKQWREPTPAVRDPRPQGIHRQGPHKSSSKLLPVSQIQALPFIEAKVPPSSASATNLSEVLKSLQANN